MLNREDNVPGGEPAPDGEEVGAACRAAGKDQFALGLGFLSASLVLVLVTVLGSPLRPAPAPSAAIPPRAPASFVAAAYIVLLMGLLLSIVAVFLLVVTRTEDVTDLRPGDKSLGGFGYVLATIFGSSSIAALAASVLGPRLWNQQRTSAAVTLVATAGGLALSIISLVGAVFLSLL